MHFSSLEFRLIRSASCVYRLLAEQGATLLHGPGHRWVTIDDDLSSARQWTWFA